MVQDDLWMVQGPPSMIQDHPSMNHGHICLRSRCPPLPRVWVHSSLPLLLLSSSRPPVVGDLALERLLLMSSLAPCGWRFGAGAPAADELSPPCGWWLGLGRLLLMSSLAHLLVQRLGWSA